MFSYNNVLSIKGLAYRSPQKSHGSQSLSSFSYEYNMLFLYFLDIGVSYVQVHELLS